MIEVDVAFSGSSTKAPGHAGFAEALNSLKPVRVSGSSGGAIVAAAWSLRGSEFVKEMVVNTNFKKYLKVNWWSLAKFAFYGYVSNGDALYKDLQRAFRRHTFSSPKLSSDLYITASNMTDGELEIYSRETTPTMPLALAVYRSVTLPGVFKPKDRGRKKIFMS